MTNAVNGTARTIASRPAESAGGLAAAVAVLIVYALGIDDPGVFAALTVVVGAVPAAVTFAVNLVRRRQPEAGG